MMPDGLAFAFIHKTRAGHGLAFAFIHETCAAQTYRQLLELFLALAGTPEDALQLTAACQHICCKGEIGPKLMHHCAQQLLLHT